MINIILLLKLECYIIPVHMNIDTIIGIKYEIINIIGTDAVWTILSLFHCIQSNAPSMFSHYFLCHYLLIVNATVIWYCPQLLSFASPLEFKISYMSPTTHKLLFYFSDSPPDGCSLSFLPRRMTFMLSLFFITQNFHSQFTNCCVCVQC